LRSVGDSLPDDYGYLPIRPIPTIIKRNLILPECADPLSGTCNLKQAMQPETQFSDIAVSSLLQMRLWIIEKKLYFPVSE